MATCAVKEAVGDSSSSSNNGLCIVVAGADHVKFGYGLQERAIRYLNTLQPDADARAAAPGGGARKRVFSILLNPTALDSLSLTAQLRYVLAYGPFLKDQRLLSDYVWFSNYPPLKLLARKKNPINKEGDKPPGESSIIGAF